MTRVLILGGYGTFGGRLAQLLADEPRLALVIAGRSLAKANEFCAAFRGNAKVEPLAFDRDGDVERQLRAATAPDIVVDASGPFQAYENGYAVVRACLALGIDYLDLADGADFVNGIAQFDTEAKARGRFVLSGVSSFPVLTAAAVRKLSDGMTRIEHVTAGIAPSPFAGLGLNVIRAVSSYAGADVTIGPGARRTALVDSRNFTIAVPGRLPLRPRRFSLVDAPDIRLLPALWPDLQTVWTGVGTMPGSLHRLLNVCAWLARWKLLPPLSLFAPLMHRVINTLRWGEHRGGMFVAIDGTDAAGARLHRSWNMIAEGDDGPFIPSMPAEVIVRRYLEGRRPEAGARPATRELELADYEPSFARRRIVTGTHQTMPPTMPLYRRMLGEAWRALPDPVRRMHDLEADMVAEGVAQIDRGDGWIARLIAALVGFPQAGRDVPVRVSFTARDGREIWRRDFGGRGFASTQEEGRGRFERLLCERFGPFAFGLALVLDGGRLHLVPRCASFLGLPWPLAQVPGGDAYESGEDGRFNFHVEIGHPLTGLIVRYRGWLMPQRRRADR